MPRGVYERSPKEMERLRLFGVAGWNRGKRLTEEHKANIGRGNKGKRTGKTWEEIYGEGRAGELRVEHAERFKNWAEHPWRHPRTEEEKAFLRSRPAKCGEEHWNWQGGITRYYKYLDGGWPEKRKQIYERDSWSCQICGVHCHGRSIQCHHISPFNFSEYSGDDNLVTLCNSCHNLEDRAILSGNSLMPVVGDT
jgi:hypothetical protein